jgi:hypothetical protein
VQQIRSDLAEISKGLGEKAQLLQRIKALEAELRQRDGK